MTCCIFPCRPARAGVSLLEVLISIFVVLIGLLGVAAVIPAGRVELVEAAKADRSSACAASAMQHLRTGFLFDPRLWICYNDSNSWAYVVNNGLMSFNDSYIVDPLFYARQATLTGISIPWYPGGTAPTTAGVGAGRRVTFPQGATYMQLPLADRAFTWQDDLLIPVPKNRNERPRQMLIDSTGVGTVTPATALVPQVQGDYTWLFTVTPNDPQPRPGYSNQIVADGTGQFIVSVAVFYKRSFELWSASDPGEPFGTVTFTGGADVVLGVDSSRPATWLNVKEHEWIPVGGYTKYVAANSSVTPPTPECPSRYVIRWYRIVALGEVDATAKTRAATLAGPDWDLLDSPTGNTARGYAVFYRGVVNVNTTTMKLSY